MIELSDDQYGNYVIQHILERGKSEDKDRVYTVMKGHVLTMSMHKFASNVVEKVLQHGAQTHREVVHEEILRSTSGEQDSPIVQMMKDQYGNYVVQKMLEYSSDTERDKIVTCIKENSAQLKTGTYGKHLITRLEKVTGIHLDGAAPRAE